MRAIRLSNGNLLIPVDPDEPDAGDGMAEITPDDPHYGKWLPFAVDGEDTRNQRTGREGEQSHASNAPGSGEAHFWRTRSAEELAAEQDVQLPQDVDRLIGLGAELWDSDADFERWLEWLREIHREGH